MGVNVETLGTLERRLSMSVSAAEVERQVGERLKKIARDAKMPGFRPGKVPMKLVVQQYGPRVQSEVLGDAVQKSFDDAVKQANLKVAGYPRIEPKEGGSQQSIEFSATFEIYPEVKTGDLSKATVERPGVSVDDAAVDKTLEVLRKQRVQFVPAGRAAQDGDRLCVDFDGKIGGEEFEGGKAADFRFVLGEGRMLAEFEQAARGMSVGEGKSFDLKFPEDYHGKDVAGKKATFSLVVKEIDAPQLPALDAEFARSLGIQNGDLAKMREEIRGNVEREVKKRVESRIKNGVMQALLDCTPIELPKSLIEMESRQLVERAAADLQARGMKLEKLPFEPKAFEATAKRRVGLGLIIGELARSQNLQPKPAEVRALIEQEAQSYDSPAEVVKWFYMQPQRLSEMEGLALEANVVNWVLSKVTIVDKVVPFDELMSSS
ncbi:MAG: trigger factor [Betaproteobacteria bacterium]|nr:trigger factor [Betaproteobacteria bacterium]